MNREMICAFSILSDELKVLVDDETREEYCERSLSHNRFLSYSNIQADKYWQDIHFHRITLPQTVHFFFSTHWHITTRENFPFIPWQGRYRVLDFFINPKTIVY